MSNTLTMRGLIDIAEGKSEHEQKVHALTSRWTKRRDRGGSITLYRVIGVREEWEDRLRPGTDLGSHWSARSDMHIHEFPITEEVMLLTVKAPATAILVDDTVGCWLVYPEEAEVCLHPGTPVRLISIMVLDTNQKNGLAYRAVRDVRPDLKGTTFLAGNATPVERTVPAPASPDVAKSFWDSYYK